MIVFNESVSGKTVECKIPRRGSGFLLTADLAGCHQGSRIVGKCRKMILFQLWGSPTIPEEAGTQHRWFDFRKRSLSKYLTGDLVGPVAVMGTGGFKGLLGME